MFCIHSLTSKSKKSIDSINIFIFINLVRQLYTFYTEPYRRRIQLKIVSLIGSTRKGGNTEQLADYVLQNIEYQKIYISDLHIKPIEDLRHTESGFQSVKDDYHQVIHALMTSDVVIFATPIYWYTMSGTMKNMIDRLSQAIRDKQYPHLKENLKTIQAIVIAVGGDEPRIKGLPLVQQFKYTFDFLNIPFSSYIIGEGNKPGEILNDHHAMAEATWLNEELKQKLTNS